MRTVPGPTDSVVVIGAGLGGLSAALRLAGAGRTVTVLERGDSPGGAAAGLRLDGYCFDAGPTVLTMPELIADALACVGERLEDRLELIPLDPAYRARFPDGSTLDVHTDADAMAEEVRRVCGPGEVDGFRRLVRFLRELYEREMPAFIDRNLDSPRDVVGSAAAHLVRMGTLRRLDRVIGHYVRDERLRRVFTFQSLYAGVAPHQALGVYAVIAYMDCVHGVWYPRGGMQAVGQAMADAAADHGVELRYGTAAARIETVGGRARSVITESGERIPCDAVVVNAGLPGAYRDLLPDVPTPRRPGRPVYSPSCALLHVGSAHAPPDAAHHTIGFGTAWRDTFADIIRRGRPMSDPSFLVSSPTVTDPSLAPPGRHTYYVLFPTPNLQAAPRIDWSVLGPHYRDEMVATLEARGFAGFGDGIEVEQLITPADWHAAGAEAGTPFAASHVLRQTGPLRPATLPRGAGSADNVVFAGAHTQPGVGVPMVLVSGRLAAERITGRVRA